MGEEGSKEFGKVLGPEYDFSAKKQPVASTRQDKIQLNEVASAKTSARVSVTLLVHVLLGLLIALFVISIFMSVLTFSAPLPNH